MGGEQADDTQLTPTLFITEVDDILGIKGEFISPIAEKCW